MLRRNLLTGHHRHLEELGIPLDVRRSVGQAQAVSLHCGKLSHRQTKNMNISNAAGHLTDPGVLPSGTYSSE